MRKDLITGILVLLSHTLLAQTPDSILLSNYRPASVYKIPTTKITKAKFPVIDMHSHPYAPSVDELERWVRIMNQYNIEKTIILTYATGDRFDSLYQVYNQYSDRFEVWCGFDYSGYHEKGWSQKAVKELERCFKVGARGVGELGDKGTGLKYSHPSPAPDMHIDDSRMRPLIEKCGELGMPINIHVAEPIWMYNKQDSTNDGLMNGYKWRIDLTEPNILDHQELIQTLENAVEQNPGTTFIACHFANCSYDLSIVGDLLDKYPNFYADISARYGETAPIPRYMKEFYSRYQDRLLFGTDMGYEPIMYQVVFRILETEDEHFYQQDYFNYHWPLHGFGLSDEILKKVYYENAKKILD
ncbi:amidohydrolase family protein [Marinoscillum sp.]|uniref:amidohydrolase family protein n=1 Tax=Marinoscillum sp. TaxID=2024838 RepID=UPI003BAB3E7F